MASVPPHFISSQLTGNKPTLGVCSASGINLLSKERIRLTQLRVAMQTTVAEMRKSVGRDELLSHALLAASLTKATCDAFIEMAGALGKLAGLKGTDEFAKVYGAASAVTTTATQTALGQKADWIGTASSVGKVVVKSSDVADIQFLKVDILNAALQRDTPKLLQVSFMEYPAKIAEMSLAYMGHAASARWVGSVTAVVSSGLSYSRALDVAFNTRLEDKEFAFANQQQLLGTHHHIAIVSSRITDIETIMNGCGARVLQLQ